MPISADPLPLRAGRTLLRRLTTEDVRDFQSYRTDPEVGRWQGWQPMSGAQALAFLAEMRRAPLFQPGEWAQIAIALPEPEGAPPRPAPEALERLASGFAAPGTAPLRGGPLIGDIGLVLHPGDPPSAEIGFTLHPRWQGQGLAAEAVDAARAMIFRHTRAARLIAQTDTRNAASIRLLERVGFIREATIDAIFRGEPCREHQYVSVRP